MSPTPLRLASAPWDYRRLGLVPGHVAPRENRTHLDRLPGSMEWWFMEAATPDGNASIAITTDPNFGGTSGVAPASLGIVRLDGAQPVVEGINCQPEDLHSLADDAGVSLPGNNYFRATGADSYRSHFEGEELEIDIELTHSVPSWRPESGHFIFGEHDESYFGWTIPAPIADSHLVIRGRGLDIDATGVGYIDRGWTNRAMPEFLNNWVWYHWRFGEYTVAAIDITFEKEFGYPEFPVLMVYRDGRLLAGGPGTQNRDHIRFDKDSIRNDPDIDRQIAGTFSVGYHDGDDRFELTVDNTSTTEVLSFFDKPDASGQPGAGTIGKRFTGPASFSHYHRGELVARRNLDTGSAVCEQLFIGPPRES